MNRHDHSVLPTTEPGDHQAHATSVSSSSHRGADEESGGTMSWFFGTTTPSTGSSGTLLQKQSNLSKRCCTISIATMKILQRRLFNATSTTGGLIFTVCLVLLGTLAFFKLVSETLFVFQSFPDCIAPRNNIGEKSFGHHFCPPQIDAVYTWVNGSDPVWLAQLQYYKELSEKETSTEEKEGKSGQDDAGSQQDKKTKTAAEVIEEKVNELRRNPVSSNRYRDNEELRYSLRSLEKYAPWIRHIYIVTNGQVPSWLDLSDLRVSIVSHEEIFPDPSVLPVFSSPSIEAHLHRIPGLSKKFIYFNDDVFLGAPTWPSDFWSPETGQKVYLVWDVPRCNEGCVHAWIGDGYCDVPCNTSSCSFDGGDCKGQYAGRTQLGAGMTTSMPQSEKECASGCPVGWLADSACDPSCRVADCAWDMGDCGMNTIKENIAVTPLQQKGPWVGLPYCDTEETYVNVTALSRFSISHHPVRIRNDTRVMRLSVSEALERLGFQLASKRVAELSTGSVSPDGSLCASFTSLDKLAKSMNKKITSADQDVRAPVLATAFVETDEELLYLFDRKNLVSFVDLTKGLQKTVQDNRKLSLSIQLKDARFISLEPSLEGDDSSINLYDCAFVSWVDDNLSALKKLRNAKHSKEHTLTALDLQNDPEVWKLFPSLSAIEDANVDILSDTAAMVIKLGENFRSSHCKQVFQEDAVALPGLYWDANIDLDAFFDEKPEQAVADLSLFRCTGSPFIRDMKAECKVDSVSSDEAAWMSTAAGTLNFNIESIGTITPASLYSSIEEKVAANVRNRIRAQSSTKKTNSSTPVESERKLLEHSLLQPREMSKESPVVSLLSMSDDERKDFVTGAWRKAQGKESSDIEPSAASRKLMDLFADSLIHTDNMLSTVLPRRDRKVVAHMPHMIDKDVMNELQSVFHEEFEATGSRRFRSSEDIQYSFAYFYWLMEGTKQFGLDLSQYWKDEIDTDHNGYLDDNEFRTLAAVVYGRPPDGLDMSSLRECLASGDIILRSSISLRSLMYCRMALDGLAQHARIPRSHTSVSADEVTFEMVTDDYNETIHKLDKVRHRKTKFVCINDDMHKAPNSVQRALRNLYISYFPLRSRFELPRGFVNRNAYIDSYRQEAYIRFLLRLTVPFLLVAFVATVARSIQHHRSKW
eukprot:gb/GECG01008314.1/.p1 GENE.gb/GECG01008314.1/~~gb/GECG01008314.1/.p1  ORF type:complete len:1154 (+),score=123.58 gb/GECG01008314.1/:1-3462(+)